MIIIPKIIITAISLNQKQKKIIEKSSILQKYSQFHQKMITQQSPNILDKDIIIMNPINVTCERGPTHLNMPILMVCLEKTCTLKRLSCISCVDELHTRHELMSLKKFCTYVDEVVNTDFQSEEKTNILASVQSSRECIRQEIQNMKLNFDSQINDLLKKLDEHYDGIVDNFKQQKIVNASQSIQQQLTDSNLQRLYQHLKKAQQSQSKPLQQIKTLTQTLHKSISQNVQTCTTQTCCQLQKITKYIQNLKLTKTIKSKYIFNQDNKSAYLTLLHDGLSVERTTGTGGYPIAVVKQQFTQDCHTVGFRILDQPGNKGVWIGVCVLEVVKGFNFQGCYGIGKGTWGIDQVGEHHSSAYTWSHHDANYNSAPKVGWQFLAGDLVEITVDFEKSLARFTKNKQQYYQQPIRLDLGPIHAFAGPTHLNDIITLV